MTSKTEQEHARTELLAVLALLVPAVKEQADREPLELGCLNLDAIHNALVTTQEYLHAELEADRVVPRKQRPDIDQWLSTETTRLVGNTVAAYGVPYVEVLQAMTAHLVAGAVMYGATYVAAELEADATDEAERKQG